MNFSSFGIIIKVQDLDLCRRFYRDVLDLGEPAMDSNFRVEFRLRGSSLFLVSKDWADPLPETGGRLAWYFGDGDPDRISKKIQAAGFACRCLTTVLVGQEMVRFTDPEGNPFYVSGKLKSQKGDSPCTAD